MIFSLIKKNCSFKKTVTISDLKFYIFLFVLIASSFVAGSISFMAMVLS